MEPTDRAINSADETCSRYLNCLASGNNMDETREHFLNSLSQFQLRYLRIIARELRALKYK